MAKIKDKLQYYLMNQSKKKSIKINIYYFLLPNLVTLTVESLVAFSY